MTELQKEIEQNLRIVSGQIGSLNEHLFKTNLRPENLELDLGCLSIGLDRLDSRLARIETRLASIDTSAYDV